MSRVSTEFLKEKLLRVVIFPVLGIFQLLNFWQNLSTVAYKAVAYKKINVYPEELELKLEHSGSHASFLNLDITILEGEFVYKLFDKRDAFPFSIVRMPFINSNIPESIFYSALIGEFLRIARSTLKLADFLIKAKDLCKRMENQGARRYLTERNIRKIVSRHEDDFRRFEIHVDDLIHELL